MLAGLDKYGQKNLKTICLWNLQALLVCEFNGLKQLEHQATFDLEEFTLQQFGPQELLHLPKPPHSPQCPSIGSGTNFFLSALILPNSTHLFYNPIDGVARNFFYFL